MFVVAGESLIDLVSEPRDRSGLVRMQAHQGGSPYNCAIALAKLGGATGFLCPISTDGFGDYLLEPLRAAAVTQLLPVRTDAPTTLAVVTLNDRRQAQYQFYREGTADHDFTCERLIAALPSRIAAFQFGGFCPILPRDAAIWLDVAAEAGRRGATICMDPNLRPSLVDDFPAYQARLEKFFSIVHLVKLSDEDLRLLDPVLAIEDHARTLLARPNCQLVVVTLGEAGSRAFSRSGEANTGIYSPPNFGDTVGAGDCLMAGVLTAIADRGALAPDALGALDERALGEILRFGSVAAGLNCAHFGCHPPSRVEVEAVLAG
ncbi:MAG: carbohydrate kinase [Cucumibacter sp.]